MIGRRVEWMAVNGPQMGVIEAKFGGGYLARLDNGKCVIIKISDERLLEKKTDPVGRGTDADGRADDGKALRAEKRRR